MHCDWLLQYKGEYVMEGDNYPVIPVRSIRWGGGGSIATTMYRLINQANSGVAC